jgi:hypothetical protein
MKPDNQKHYQITCGDTVQLPDGRTARVSKVLPGGRVQLEIADETIPGVLQAVEGYEDASALVKLL